MSDVDSQQQVPPVVNAVQAITFNLATHPLDGDIDLSTTNGYKAFNTAQEVDENEARSVKRYFGRRLSARRRRRAELGKGEAGHGGRGAESRTQTYSSFGRHINGSYKALQPQMQLESRFSSEWRWMECWLWAAVAVWGAMVVSAAVVLSLVWLLQRLEKYRAKYREKTSSFSTPNRGGFARYLLANEPEKRLSISVSNSTEFHLRVKHKVDQCRLHAYLMFGTAGTGVPTVTPARTRGQPDDVNLNEITDLHNLLTNHTALTLSECQAIAQYNWGENSQTRSHGADLVLQAIDPTDLINGGVEAYELKRLK
eukprot:scaffold74389_cov38-Cyclotella_meneghiniana.AAC.1